MFSTSEEDDDFVKESMRYKYDSNLQIRYKYGPTVEEDGYEETTPLLKEPIGDKSVRDLPGIGDTHGDMLEDDGYDKAYMVLGKFLVLGKDEEKLKDWLMKKCEMKMKKKSKKYKQYSEDLDECCKYLKAYCRIHMPSTSKKHVEFVREPIGDKSVRKLPGIGDSYGRRLVLCGYDKAYRVLGKFLDLKKDEEEFKKWLKEMCEASSEDSNHLHACYLCLKEYCEIHMPSTSRKHVEFVREPMRNKSVTKLPGIGDSYGRRLVLCGYDKSAFSGSFENASAFNQTNGRPWIKESQQHT